MMIPSEALKQLLPYKHEVSLSLGKERRVGGGGGRWEAPSQGSSMSKILTE